MLGRIVKGVKWLLVLLIALPLVFYVTLLLINLSDEDKSAQVLVFEDILSEKSNLDNRQNAFIYLIGITAHPDEDGYLIGQQRIEQWHTQPATDTAPLYTDYFDIDDIDAQLKSILSTCGQSMPFNDGCHQNLLNKQEEIVVLLKKNQLLLQRYRMIFKLEQWHEILPQRMVANGGIRHQLLILLQKLNMLAIWQIGSSDNTAEIQLLLVQQGSFSRNILSSADTLVTKMVATAVVEQYFHWLDFILDHGDKLLIKPALIEPLTAAITK